MGCCLSSDYEPPPSCNICSNLPSNDIFVVKIYHCGKYNGVHLCKICLYKKMNKIESKYSSI